MADRIEGITLKFDSKLINNDYFVTGQTDWQTKSFLLEISYASLKRVSKGTKKKVGKKEF